MFKFVLKRWVPGLAAAGGQAATEGWQHQARPSHGLARTVKLWMGQELRPMRGKQQGHKSRAFPEISTIHIRQEGTEAE